MAKKVIIIGAGVYGIGVGNYLAMNGFEVVLHEMHSIPGGLCTAWKQKGYTFDFCLHWLMGSSPGKNMNRLWREAGVLEGRRFHEPDIYLRWSDDGGHAITIFTDPRKFRDELMAVAPEDASAIEALIRGIRAFSRFDYAVCREDYTLSTLLQTLRGVPSLLRWNRVSMEAFRARLKNPVLKRFFQEIVDPVQMPDFPAMAFMLMLGFMASRSNGYPLGGSLALAMAWEARLRRNGGTVKYGSRVTGILVENGKAVGVRLGEQVERADLVISAADGHTTLNNWLGGRYHSPRIDEAYRNWKRFPSLLFICLGLGRRFEGEPAMQVFPARRPLSIEGGAQTLRTLGLRLFHDDPGSAPAGKTSATSMIATDQDAYWCSLREKDPTAYAAEKQRLIEWVIDECEARFGGVRNAVEVTDLSTPATIVRYTGNWHGSYEGWVPTTRNLMVSLPDELPGLSNFYMTGQWVTPGGGVPPAAMKGRALAQKICRREKVRFRVVE
jgi:phytoene dehydrogenase-like protein